MSLSTPQQKETCSDASKFVPALSLVLTQITKRNDVLPQHPENTTVFDAIKPPSISIHDYLQRIVKYAYCSGECFILSLIYLDRIIQKNPAFYITSLNVHRLLITSVLVSVKYHEDQYYNNAYYARVAGLSCSELNMLELHLLKLVDFSLHTTPDLFNKYKVELTLNTLQVDRGVTYSARREQVRQQVQCQYNQYTKSYAPGMPQGTLAISCQSYPNNFVKLLGMQEPFGSNGLIPSAGNFGDGFQPQNLVNISQPFNCSNMMQGFSNHYPSNDNINSAMLDKGMYPNNPSAYSNTAQMMAANTINMSMQYPSHNYGHQLSGTQQNQHTQPYATTRQFQASFYPVYNQQDQTGFSSDYYQNPNLPFNSQMTQSNNVGGYNKQQCQQHMYM